MEPALYDHFERIEDDHWWWRARRAIVLELLKNLRRAGSPARVLEVGCGMGAQLSALPPEFEGYGTEISEQAVRRCRERGLSRVVLCEGADLPFERGFFQVAMALDVLEHLDGERPLLDGLSNVLEDGGTLLVTVPAHAWLWTRWDDMNRHKRRYTRTSLTAALRSAGFEVRFCSYFNFFMFPLAVLRRVLDGLVRTADGADLPAGARIPAAWMNRTFAFVFGVERLLLARERHFPCGSSVLAVARKRGPTSSVVN